MKQVLIIDESPMFRDYLSLKLEENDIEAIAAHSPLDGIAKMKDIVPDLVIVDYHLSRPGIMDVLKQKRLDPNTVNIPVIIMAQHIDQRRLIELVPHNIKKVFNKPVKVDALFHTVSEVLGVPFSIDESPGIVEVHVNDSIIFIEIAQGLNWDKLDLLRFKIAELIGIYEIKVPRLIIMLSNIKLGFADGPSIEKLLDTVIEASKTKMRYIRVLTLDDFTCQFIRGQQAYHEIEVVSNLQYAVNDLLSGVDEWEDQGGGKAELIGDRILQAKHRENPEAMALKFEAEAKQASFELVKDSLQNLRIAVIDNDIAIQEVIRSTFEKAGSVISAFSSGDEYLAVIDREEFDLAFLDIDMPREDGFQVLKVLQTRYIKYPVIALSSVVQREVMIKAVQMGVRSYLLKPLNPDDVFKKSVEILKANI